MSELIKYHATGLSKNTTGHKSFLAIVLALTVTTAANAEGLTVKFSTQGKAYIAYNNTPAFGYGASPQNILTYLPSGNGNNYKIWLDWANKNQMNHVRSYPPSIIVPQPAVNLFHNAHDNKNKFDLNKLNQTYFDELRRACQLMKKKGFFVHLQLWQAVAWKSHWQHNYYNPLNNINSDVSQHAGPGEFMVLKNPLLLEHQKQYVYKVLDATADLGNVYFDIANEIGNGTGSHGQWVMEILNAMRQWENKNDRKILITINDEGGVRVEEIENIFEKLDLIIKDLGRWDEHVTAQREYRKPSLSVRNIDWDYKTKERQYFARADNLELNENNKLQTRGRKYWWRMYMAKVQMAAAYADTYDEIKELPGAWLAEKILNKLGVSNLMPSKMVASYKLNNLAENNFVHFRNFIDNIVDYPNLLPYDDIVKGHPAKHNYCLQSSKEIVIYLESPNGNAGYTYPETQVSLTGLMIKDGSYSGFYYHPESGKKIAFEILISNNKAKLLIPGFKDDLAIYIR
jgi:hypothetical protein